MSLRIGRERPDQPSVIALINALDAYQRALYPAESNHLLDVATLLARNTIFCVARRDDVPVACGAAVIEADVDGVPFGEIKRMYVDPTQRGLGLGRKLLAFLEAELLQAGVGWARLETGIRQPEAVNLYARAGYTEIGPFGAYQPDPLSRFFEKELAFPPYESVSL